MQVGELLVTPVLDGRFELPATLFFPKTYDDDWIPHRQFLNDDGMLPLDEMRFGRLLPAQGKRQWVVP